MSSTVKCKAITNAGNRCSRNAVVEGLCTQHYNKLYKNIIDEVKTSVIPEDEYYINDLPVDVIQYTINGYLDYVNDIPNLEILLKELKLNIEPHITIQDSFNPKTKLLSKRETFLDDYLIKREEYYNNGIKQYEYNYKYVTKLGSKKDGKQYGYYKNGNLEYISEYFDGRKIGETKYF